MAKQLPLNTKGFHPFGELIGLTFTACEAGSSRCVLAVKETLLNPHEVLHGGVIYTMADTGMGGALYTLLEPDELCTTIEIKIAYYEPVIAGDIVCLTDVLHKKRKIASLESRIYTGETLVSKATGTFYIYKTK
jgi:acyl-CoA thioesterase